MAREKVDNKLNVVIGTKAQIEADNTIPDNSIIIVTDEELTPSEIGAVAANADITAGTGTKITYDAKGLVTGGANLVESNIPPLAISKVTNLQFSLNNKVDKVNGREIAKNKQDINELRGRVYYSPDEVSLFSFIPSNDSNTFRVGGTDLKVDWGDGETEVINSTVTHTYAEPYKRVMVVIEKGTITELGINFKVDFMSLGKNNITKMTNLLYGYKNIRMISYFNTSNTTSTDNLFAFDTELLEVPFMDVSKVTDAYEMFLGCYKLVSVPPLNFNAVTDIGGLFRGCSSLIEVPALITNGVTEAEEMFQGCWKLVSVPLFDTSNVADLSKLFYDCKSLVEVPGLDAGKADDMFNTFYGCTSLRRIHMINFNADFNITDTALEHDALIEVISNLKPQEGETKKLTMGAEKLALLSDEEKAVATGKGWYLA